MTDIVALPRCTCAEVYGDDPRCVLHGTATAWALDNTTPDEWQNQALDQMECVAMMDRQINDLRAQLAQAGVALEDIAQWGDAAMAFGSTAVDMRATARGVLAKLEG